MTNSVQLEDASCPLGCTKNDEVLFTGRDLIRNLPGEYQIVKCRTCGLIRTNPRPTLDSIGLYYPDDYGPYLDTQVRKNKPKWSTGIKKIFGRFVRRALNSNTQRLPFITPGRMLEIGCASGAYLHQMACQGWQVQGIEFSDKAAQMARQLGYHVHSGPLETAQQHHDPFDLIVGWMVLEHLHDPIGGLQKLRECAKPGSWLVLSVPNAASRSFGFFKHRWYDLHLPNHLYHFTPTSIEKILSASGWKLEKIHHQRVLNNLLASLGYLLRDTGCTNLGNKLIKITARRGKWSYFLFPLAWLLSLFGQTGRMTIWATPNE